MHEHCFKYAQLDAIRRAYPRLSVENTEQNCTVVCVNVPSVEAVDHLSAGMGLRPRRVRENTKQESEK